MDKELVSVIKYLLGKNMVTARGLEEASGMTRRQINYRIEKINSLLSAGRVPPIVCSTKKDIFIEAATRYRLVEMLEEFEAGKKYYFSKRERLAYIYLLMFIGSEYLTLNHLMASLRISRSSVVLDLKELSPALAEHGIEICNNRERGYYLAGTEMNIRHYMMKIVISMLAEDPSSRVFHFFINDLGLDSFEQSKKIITDLCGKHAITFVDDRLVEFVYIFIFMTRRMLLGSRVEIRKLSDTEAMTSMKEYQFAEELLKTYQIRESIDKTSVKYITAWILGISVGSVDDHTSDHSIISDIVNQILVRFEALSGVHYKNYQDIFRQLYSHFRPAYYRLLFNLPIINPLAAKIKEEYTGLYTLVSEVMKPFELLFGGIIQDDELAYLTIHFVTIFSNRKQSEIIAKKTALIVCSNGIGSSAILYNELTSLFPEINFLLPTEPSKVNRIKDHLDLIFTTSYTVDLEYRKEPIIRVSPIMTTSEKLQLTREVNLIFGITVSRQPEVDDVINIVKKYASLSSEAMLRNELLHYFSQVETSTVKGGEGPLLSNITNEKLIQLGVEAQDWEDAIRKAAKAQLEQGMFNENYIDAMINTAKDAGPYIVITKHVALPHARPEEGSNKISIGITTLKTPVKFGNKDNDPVKYVFCLSALDNKSHLKAMAELVGLFDLKEFYELLDTAKSPEQVMEFIYEFERKESEKNV